MDFEALLKEKCTPMRQDGPFIEAGENDNLIVQRIEADPNAARHLRLLVPVRERRQAAGREDRRRQARVRHHRRRHVWAFAAALHLRQERASQGRSGHG